MKTQTEEVHKTRAEEYSATQQRVRELERKMPLSIGKAKPYFDTKDKLEQTLEVIIYQFFKFTIRKKILIYLFNLLKKQKKEIETNQKRIMDAKKEYAKCLAVRIICN